MIQVSMFNVRQGNQAYLKVDNGSASEHVDILCFGDALREKRVSNAPREKRVGGVTLFVRREWVTLFLRRE